ncbi:hypothetical protein OXV65_16925 [Bacteroides fragilis]|nr:hypothetical protein [Bacteroides fragilis]MCY6324312.1 hypothetical protein [Bacteroides fragilis]
MADFCTSSSGQLGIDQTESVDLMRGADDVSTWIGFGGSYIGGIIGGVISILILNKTLRQTGVLHHDLKLLQLDTIIYT